MVSCVLVNVLPYTESSWLYPATTYLCINDQAYVSEEDTSFQAQRFRKQDGHYELRDLSRWNAQVRQMTFVFRVGTAAPV